ncbi:MAG TPA: hypothetical protein VGJ44_00325 [Kribbellaceae bacterium]
MTADQPPPREGGVDIDFALPDLPNVDESTIRRAVLRGVLRSGFAAAAWLLVIVLVLVLASFGIQAARGDTFDVARDGVGVAHPEYEIAQEGSCCGDGLTSPATSTLTLRLRSRGVIGPSIDTTGSVHRGWSGDLTTELGRSDATPVGEALGRGRVEKTAARAFLATLPKSVTASAIVEFTEPLDATAFEALSAAPPVPFGRGPIFVSPIYPGKGFIGTVCWPVPEVAAFTAWARHLDAGDNDDLDALGLPSAADLRRAADPARIYGFVLDRASVDELQALLADGRVRSINVVDAGFDPTRQTELK